MQCPGMSPVEVEQLVTYPIETAMMGMPKLQMVRSTSKLDLSMVTIIFDDSMNKYLVRQLVAERLSQVQSRTPSRASAADEPDGDCLWRGLPVHHLRAKALPDADQDPAGLGHSLCAC